MSLNERGLEIRIEQLENELQRYKDIEDLRELKQFLMKGTLPEKILINHVVNILLCETKEDFGKLLDTINKQRKNNRLSIENFY